MEYDLVIPVAPKDMDMLPHCLSSLCYLSPQPIDIYIVTPKAEPVEKILKSTNIEANIVLDVDVFDFAGMGIKPSWYQQVIKLFQSFSRGTYFVLDADVVLLRELSLVDSSGKILLGSFKCAGGPNEDYRRFMGDAFGLEHVVPWSLVSHHMVFQRSMCQEMLSEFLLRHPNSNGVSNVEWFYNWLVKMGKGYDGNVSEYEAYGQFVLGRHSGIYGMQMIPAYEFTCYGDRNIERNMGEHLHKSKSMGANMMAIHKRDSSIKREWET